MTRRRALHILARASVAALLLLLIGASAAWASSYHASQYLPNTPYKGGWRIRSYQGQLDIYRYQPPVAGLKPLPRAPAMIPAPAPFSGLTMTEPHLRGLVEFGHGASWTRTTTTRYTIFGVRYLLLCLVLGSAMLLTTLAWYLSRRRAARPGMCPICGYDLRASPERCPECGAAHGTMTA